MSTSVETAVTAALAAWPAWRALPARDRARRVRCLRRRIATEQDALAADAAAETGRSAIEVLMQEVTAVLEASRTMERRYPGWLRDRSFRYLRPGYAFKANRIQFDGLGVVAVIGPSNFPVSLVLMQTIAALLCGNTVVLKPSERCPRVAARLAALFDAAGLGDVVCTVQGGAEQALALAAHPEVAKVLFTGSTESGRAVATACARSLTPSVLELGGDAAAIVCADARLDLAAKGILWSATYAGGRACVATRRVYVVASVADAFEARLKDLGSWVPDPDARITSLDVCRVASENEAVERINGGATGLSASVWSRDVRRARRIARSLRVGLVWVNDVGAGMPGMPWGGRGDSGWGRLYARLAIPELTHVRCVSAERRFTSRSKFWWYPYTESKRALVRRVNRLLYGTGRSG